MGYFDFTYADNGKNTRGHIGYLYMTESFCEKIGLTSPLRYDGMNAFGGITIRTKEKPKSESSLIVFDIYAFYACMLHLESLCSNHPKECQEYMDIVKFLIHSYRQIQDEDKVWQKVEELETAIRTDGVAYFFDERTLIKEQPFTIPPLRKRPAQTISKSEVFSGKLPLLISALKLPANPKDNIYTIAKNWGYVSDTDPRRGNPTTTNHWLPFQPK